MTARPGVSLGTLLALRLRLTLAMWRYLAGRALKRLVRRAVDWLEPAG